MTNKLLAATATALAAVPAAMGLTAEGMLASNRYSDAMPNPSGDFALYSVSNYSFETKEDSFAWKKLDLKSGEHSTWFQGEDISEVVFVGKDPNSILYVNATNAEGNGGVSLYSADATKLESSAKLVASLPAPYSGLKAALTPSGDIHFLMYAQAWPNGTVYNEELAAKPASSGRVYDTIYPRHWDVWLGVQRNAVFGGKLTKTYGEGWQLQGDLTNYVTGMCNVSCAESPYDQSDQSDYDIAPDGSSLVFLTKDIGLPRANFTSTQIYHVAFDGTRDDAVAINPRGGTPYKAAQGASTLPTFSPDGKKLAYVQMDGIDYEADRNKLYVADIPSLDVTLLAANWDRSVGHIEWSGDSSTIYTAAEDLGRTRIFPVPLTAGDDFKPSNITNDGTVVGYYTLPDGNLLVADSKLWSSRDLYTVSPEDGTVETVFLRSNEVEPALKGLSSADVSEFWYATNSSDAKQQAFIVYPQGFDANKKYPLAFWTHGGPQGNWPNGWSTRWNAKVWADQGYVVIMPNPTASTGFGQNLTDAIQGHWGDYPYWDLVHAWRYVRDNLEYVDTDNGIEAGASFGGYMTNWMQGHEMGRWFKCLVTHDGSTSTLNQYASEELWFMNHDFNGPFNETGLKPGSPYYDWNPLLYINNWETPHFVIHNDLDYRLPVSEGVMLFNLLQVKGVPSRLLEFPDENHHVLDPENSKVWHDEIFRWINHYSGIKPGDW